MNPVFRSIGVALLYLLAAPTYAIIALMKVINAATSIAAIRRGVITCPHCGEGNDLDIKGRCKCGRTDYGSRLVCRCSRERATSFNCDYCDTTIDIP